MPTWPDWSRLLGKRHGEGDSATAAALRSFRGQSQREIERWTSELADGAITPETALDRLRDARTELSELLKNHADTVIEGFARNEKEATLMRKEMESAQAGPKARYGRAYEPSILGTVYPSYYFFSVPTFNAGFNTGVSNVSSARGGGVHHRLRRQRRELFRLRKLVELLAQPASLCSLGPLRSTTKSPPGNRMVS